MPRAYPCYKYGVISHLIRKPLAIRVKINHQIKAPELRVVTAEGENLGVISLQIALAEAQKRGLDLIEISPSALPPVAKISSRTVGYDFLYLRDWGT